MYKHIYYIPLFILEKMSTNRKLPCSLLPYFCYCLGSSSCSLSPTDNPRVNVDNPRVNVDDPRVNVDNPRISVDNPRVSVDNPRVSVVASIRRTHVCSRMINGCFYFAQTAHFGQGLQGGSPYKQIEIALAALHISCCLSSAQQITKPDLVVFFY